MLPLSEKTKLGLISGSYGVGLCLLLCASLKSGLLVQMEAIIHKTTLHSDFHPYRHSL